MDDSVFGRRLHHDIPSWVSAGALFHIRIRCAAENPHALTHPPLAAKLLESARFYKNQGRWALRVFLLMPDHVHALVCFPIQEAMTKVIANWKAFHAKRNGIAWQNNFFDHRIRNDEQIDLKIRYIRMNPVVKGLCDSPDDWPWVLHNK